MQSLLGTRKTRQSACTDRDKTDQTETTNIVTNLMTEDLFEEIFSYHVSNSYCNN